MGYIFPGSKRSRPDKWEPSAQDLKNAEKLVFQSKSSSLVLQGRYPSDTTNQLNKEETSRNKKKSSFRFKRKTSTTREARDVIGEENGSGMRHERMWRSAVDHSTNKTYYYNRKTGERSWKKPQEIKQYEQSIRDSKDEIEKTHRSSYLLADNECARTVATLVESPSSTSSSGEHGETEVVDMYSLSTEEFSMNVRSNSADCLVEVYEMDYTVHKSLVSGTLSVPLPQDIFHLVETQLRVVDDYLIRNELVQTETGNRLLVDCLVSILRNISVKQSQYKGKFVDESLESCVAAANSFLWTIEKVDELMNHVQTKYSHLNWSENDCLTWMVCQEAKDLVAQFGKDAVDAASIDAVLFIMDEIHESGLSFHLFSHEWEEEWTRNQVAVSMTRIFEQNLSKVANWFEQDFLYHKLVGALVRATSCFYIEGIVNKAEKLRSAKKTLGKKTAKRKYDFRNPSKAVVRISHDIQVLRDYFQDIASGNATLARIVTREFSMLVLLVECMMHAVNQSTADSLEGFIILIHKETGADTDITRLFMSDIWLLMAPKNEHLAVEDAINLMHAELQVFSMEDLTNKDSCCFRLDQVLKDLYKSRIRNEKSYLVMAEESFKKKRRELKKDIKSSSKLFKNFFEDLDDKFFNPTGQKSTLAEI